MALREQRARDFNTMLNKMGRKGGMTVDNYHRLQAWLWWGWDINGRGGLGYPGIDEKPDWAIRADNFRGRLKLPRT